MATCDTIIAGLLYVAYDARGYAFRVTKAARARGYYATPSHLKKDEDWRRFEGDTLRAICDSISANNLFGE